jgi:hemolysin activation/secretion protein
VYTYDTRGLADLDLNTTFASHLSDDLFRNIRRQTFGARVDWTSEISLEAGDYDFRRHILNARAFLPVTPRQTLAGRFMAGWSGGELPAERLFALGGIGTVHGYRFKEAVGERMALLNAEYGLTLLGPSSPDETPLFRVLAFYDAGKIGSPLPGYSDDWLTGVGFGLQTGPFRVEFGYRTDRIPQSLQVLLRVAPTF